MKHQAIEQLQGVAEVSRTCRDGRYRAGAP